MSIQIAPSMLAADFGNLERDCMMVNSSEADWFHLDIMDGVFVPNISFGIPIVAVVQKYAEKPTDVHLMIVNPEQYINRFADLGISVLTVHFEACTHLHRVVQKIKTFGMKAGVALNPHTPVSVLEDIIQDIDLVCLMSVNPGFGGQTFILNTFEKVKSLRKLIVEKKSDSVVEIDGGVTNRNAPQLVNNGADILVAGSFVFESQDPIACIRSLKYCV